MSASPRKVEFGIAAAQQFLDKNQALYGSTLGSGAYGIARLLFDATDDQARVVGATVNALGIMGGSPNGAGLAGGSRPGQVAEITSEITTPRPLTDINANPRTSTRAVEEPYGLRLPSSGTEVTSRSTFAETLPGTSASRTDRAIPESAPRTGVQTYWPPNGGFRTAPVPETLAEGYRMSRYGGFFDESGFKDFGSFTAPENVPYGMRALPPGTDLKPYSTYEVVKPIPDVPSGPSASYFGELGLGTQHQLPMTIQDYLDQGSIRLISRSVPGNDAILDLGKGPLSLESYDAVRANSATALRQSTSSIGDFIPPKSFGVGDSASIDYLKATGAFPGPRGVAIEGPHSFGDLYELSTLNGRTIEFGLSQRVGAGGQIEYVVNNGGVGKIGFPSDVYPVAHTHPTVNRFQSMPSNADLNAMQNRVTTFLENNPGASIPPHYIIYSPTEYTAFSPLPFNYFKPIR